METIIPIAIVLIIGACCHNHHRKRKKKKSNQSPIVQPPQRILRAKRSITVSDNATKRK